MRHTHKPPWLKPEAKLRTWSRRRKKSLILSIHTTICIPSVKVWIYLFAGGNPIFLTASTSSFTLFHTWIDDFYFPRSTSENNVDINVRSLSLQWILWQIKNYDTIGHLFIVKDINNSHTRKSKHKNSILFTLLAF